MATATRSAKPKQVLAYTHPNPFGREQEPDTKPGDYYVTVRDPQSNAGHGRTGFLLGPFTDDHAAALAQVDAARTYVLDNFARSAWWAFGTARLDTADGNPVGKLNEVLGLAVAA